MWMESHLQRLSDSQMGSASEGTIPAGKCPGWASESLLQVGAERHVLRERPADKEVLRSDCPYLRGKITLFSPSLTVKRGQSHLEVCEKLRGCTSLAMLHYGCSHAEPSGLCTGWNPVPVNSLSSSLCQFKCLQWSRGLLWLSFWKSMGRVSHSMPT